MALIVRKKKWLRWLIYRVFLFVAILACLFAVFQLAPQRSRDITVEWNFFDIFKSGIFFYSELIIPDEKLTKEFSIPFLGTQRITFDSKEWSIVMIVLFIALLVATHGYITARRRTRGKPLKLKDVGTYAKNGKKALDYCRISEPSIFDKKVNFFIYDDQKDLSLYRKMVNYITFDDKKILAVSDDVSYVRRYPRPEDEKGEFSIKIVNECEVHIFEGTKVGDNKEPSSL